jgi:hypothetical protein
MPVCVCVCTIGTFLCAVYTVRLVLLPGLHTCQGTPTIDGPSGGEQKETKGTDTQAHVIFPNQLSIKSALFSRLLFCGGGR